jgi:hypothetical protein
LRETAQRTHGLDEFSFEDTDSVLFVERGREEKQESMLYAEEHTCGSNINSSSCYFQKEQSGHMAKGYLGFGERV